MDESGRVPDARSIFNDAKAQRNLRRFQESSTAGYPANTAPDAARKTLSKLHELRKREFLPDFSYDLNGDGAVSSKELYIASQFDKPKDGILDEEERKRCLEALRAGLEAKTKWGDDFALASSLYAGQPVATGPKTRVAGSGSVE